MCQQTSGPELVGCYVVSLSLLSLGSLELTLPKKNGKHNFAGQSWLVAICCVHPLSGISGIDPKVFFIPSQTFPNDRKHNFVPQGWMVATSKLCPSSLSGIFEIDSPKQMGSTSLPARVGLLLCCVQIMISKYMEAWTIQVQISKSFGCYDVFFLYLVRLTIPFHR